MSLRNVVPRELEDSKTQQLVSSVSVSLLGPVLRFLSLGGRRKISVLTVPLVLAGRWVGGGKEAVIGVWPRQGALGTWREVGGCRPDLGGKTDLVSNGTWGEEEEEASRMVPVL